LHPLLPEAFIIAEVFLEFTERGSLSSWGIPHRCSRPAQALEGSPVSPGKWYLVSPPARVCGDRRCLIRQNFYHSGRR